MVELLPATGSSGPSAAITLRERAQTHTVLATCSTNVAGGVFAARIQVADSTNGVFLDVLNLNLAAGGGEARTVNPGVYVAMRAYVLDSPSPGTITIKLYSD